MHCPSRSLWRSNAICAQMQRRSLCITIYTWFCRGVFFINLFVVVMRVFFLLETLDQLIKCKKYRFSLVIVFNIIGGQAVMLFLSLSFYLLVVVVVLSIKNFKIHVISQKLCAIGSTILLKLNSIVTIFAHNYESTLSTFTWYSINISTVNRLRILLNSFFLCEQKQRNQNDMNWYKFLFVSHID